MKIVNPSVVILDSIDGEEMVRKIEAAGRTCYKSEARITTDSSNNFIKNIIKRGHESVLEHEKISVRIICDRGVSHELVRHRIASYCIDGEAFTQTYYPSSRNLKKRKIKDLYEMTKTSHGRSRLKLAKLDCLDENTGKIIQNKVNNIFYSGKKECYEIETEAGYKIKATKDHLFYSEEGWLRLEDILKKKLKIATNGINIPTKEELYNEYITKNQKRPDVAKKYGVSDSWLGKLIAKYGIQKPPTLHPNRKGGYGKKGMFSDEQRKDISERMKGKGNPRWKGGVSREILPNEIRQKRYYLDNYSCRMCGKQKELSIHHIVPVYQDKSLFDNIDNLVTLCDKCHKKVNGKEYKYEKQFKALKPIEYSPRKKKSMLNKMVTFRSIIKSKKIGVTATYDIEMQEPIHNFIANGFVVHNSQESTRYVDYRKGMEVIAPCYWQENPIQFKVWSNAMRFLEANYKTLIKGGAKPEEARAVLPNSLKTEIVCTMNFREWRHFFKLRCAKAAHPQMRELSCMILEKFVSLIPVVFDDIVESFKVKK